MPVKEGVDFNDPGWGGVPPKMVFKALQPRHVSPEPPEHLTGGYVLGSVKAVGDSRARVVYTRPGAYGHLEIDLEDLYQLPPAGWAKVISSPAFAKDPHAEGVSVCYTLPNAGGLACRAFAEDVSFTITYMGSQDEQPDEGIEPLLQEFLRKLDNP